MMAETSQEQQPHGADDQNKEPETNPDEKDWKAEYEKLLSHSREWERRAKANKAAADRLHEIEDEQKSDAEKLSDMQKRAEQAEEKLKSYEAAAERNRMVDEIAEETGVEVDFLRRMNGDSREQIQANAEYLRGKLESRRQYPPISDSGAHRSTVTREQIEAIKDPKERIRQRALHISLYK